MRKYLLKKVEIIKSFSFFLPQALGIPAPQAQAFPYLLLLGKPRVIPSFLQDFFVQSAVLF